MRSYNPRPSRPGAPLNAAKDRRRPARPKGEGGRRSGPLRIVGLQAGVALAVVAMASIWGLESGRSALLGALAVVLPNAFFAWGAMRPLRRSALESAAEQEAMLAAGRFLGRWIAKMALTVALLAAAIVWLDAGGLAFFVGLVAALLAQLAAPLVGDL